MDILRLGRLIEIGLLFPVHYKSLDDEFKRRGGDLEDYAELCLAIEEKFNNTPIEELKSEDNHGYVSEFVKHERDIITDTFAEFISVNKPIKCGQ